MRIFVIGSINKDVFMNVPHMPQPGETLHASSCFRSLGGKGANQAVAAARLRGGSVFIGKIGSGDGCLIDELGSFGVDCKVSQQGNTGGAYIIVEKGENRIILDSGANYFLSKQDVSEGLYAATESDVLVLQQEIPTEIIEYAMLEAKQKGMKIIFNAAPATNESARLAKNADILIVNETEAEIMCGIYPGDRPKTELCLKRLKALGCGFVIITLGSKGAAYLIREAVHIDAFKVKAIDTTGAGDTFIGAIAALIDYPAESSVRFAVAASAITVTRRGAAQSIPDRNEVDEFLSRCGKNKE